jgi:cytochrome b
MKIRIWDLPTRLFHWLLVMAVIGSFVSVKLGGNAMIWHGRFGYLVLALIFFRIIWVLWERIMRALCISFDHLKQSWLTLKILLKHLGTAR